MRSAIRHLLLCLWLLALPLAGAARLQADPPLRFDELRHDFGTIREEAGPVSHTFRFRNVSGRPLVIERVLTTCGCTVAAYDRRPVLPGDEGELTVRFDPRGLTDTFHKSVRVVTDRGRSVTSLFVSGTILLAETPPEHLYEIADEVYLDRLTLPLGVVRHGASPASQRVTLLNRSKREVRLTARVEGGDDCLGVTLPARVAAGAEAQVVVTTIDRADYYGSLAGRVRLSVDGVESPSAISVYGYLVDAAARGVRVAAAPVCRVEEGGYLNLGEKPRGTRLEHRIVLRNEGRLPLIVRKVETPPFVGSDFRGERRLQPGECLVVKLSLELRQAGAVDADICVISNDARTPVKRLKIEGEVR